MSAAGRRFRAVIFDMDGVLVDSEPAFYEALNDSISYTGKRIEWEDYQQMLGTSTSATWQHVKKLLDLDGDPQQYMERFQVVLLEHLRRPRDPLPGVRPLIEGLRSRGTPVGLATSSQEEWAQAVLGAAGLAFELFDALAWRQKVAKSKPAPDLYLKAAELLGADPATCIAVEDTPSGIAAAKAAGMFAVQVRAASTAFPPINQADIVIDTLESFPLELVAGA